jgi:hypothetical protein
LVVAVTWSVARSRELTWPVLRSRRIRKRSVCDTCIWWPWPLGICSLVSTRPVTPLTRAISLRTELHSQELAS